MQTQLWMVRAGRDSVFIDEFLSRRMIAIGWSELGDLSQVESREQLYELVQNAWPENTRAQNIVSVGQLYRFLKEIVPGKVVTTYDSNRRIYHLGRVTGRYEYHPEFDPELRHVRSVIWEKEIFRDGLSAETKNSLGAISTIFTLPPAASDELLGVKKSEAASAVSPSIEDEIEEEDKVRKDVEQSALDFLQDRLTKLAWDEMQELIAGLLRAMGYKTRVAPPGSDRGRDIIASPDGFGFQPPRIMVEVKHRKGSMGAPEIRSFLGGLRQHDNGLYVSTGGFSREARYEAERANQTLTLMDSDDLGKAIFEYYDRMDAETKALLPLRKIYWPA